MHAPCGACLLTPVEGLCTPLMTWETTELCVPSILAEAGDQADLSGLKQRLPSR